MSSSEFRKILIFGQPFNNYSGGGITLTNLFRGWPNDKIAVASQGHLLETRSTDTCSSFYQFGSDEQKWRIPFNLIQRKFVSGPLPVGEEGSASAVIKKHGVRKLIVEKIFFPLLHWFGIYHSISKITLSDRFKRWLEEYSPEILYLQISAREQIVFAVQLIDYLRIPVAIHMMDDWPSTISSTGLFRNYWRKKIDKEFRQLLDRTDLFLSISDAMSAEYQKRYGKSFKAFHNPIDISKFIGRSEGKDNQGNILKILYIGRVGVANRDSLTMFARTVSGYHSELADIQFDIYTNESESGEVKELKMMDHVGIFPPVKHENVPQLLASYDILLLPLDFSERGVRFARYSIPTKASEYLASGTPVIVFAPREMAISRFCSENNCGYCVTERQQNAIVEAIDFLIRNDQYRKDISANGRFLAQKFFDGNKVRTEFQRSLLTINKR